MTYKIRTRQGKAVKSRRRMKGKANGRKVVFAAGFFLLISISGAYAYFCYWKSLKNQFSVGENSIRIDEDYQPPKELEVGDNEYKKCVKVANTGTVPCYVRVFADFSDSDIKALSCISADGGGWYPASDYPEHLPQGWEYLSREGEGEFGDYYYYTEELKPGEVTNALFDSIRTTIADAGQIKDYELIVYAESVQVLDKDGGEFPASEAWKQAWEEFLGRR